MIKNAKISIVTACYNCSAYIEKCIKSVLSQDYDNLQYIIVDGGSNDGTIEIINNYSNEIDIVISEPDDGQYYAIQKGMQLATGDVFAWLNADDTYLPWTFSVVSEIFTQFQGVDWVMGRPCLMDKNSQCTYVSNVTASYPNDFIRRGLFRSGLAGSLQQESMFWRRSLWEKSGGFDLNLRYAADFELWTRFAEYAELVSVDIPFSMFRRSSDEQRSSVGGYYCKEIENICKQLKLKPGFFTSLSEHRPVFRNLCQLFGWKKSNIVSYSQETQKWYMRQVKRAPSRVGFLHSLATK